MAFVDLRDAVKVILRLMGFLVNLAILVQAGWILSHPNTADIVEFCNWLGQGILFAFVGAAGMVLEFWTFFQFSTNLTKGFFKMVARRTMLSCFYFWLGCCALGGMRASVATARALDNHSWQVVDSQIGIQFLETSVGFCAWAIAALNLLTSCCMGDFVVEEDDMEKASLLKKGFPPIVQDPFLLQDPVLKQKTSFQSQANVPFQKNEAPKISHSTSSYSTEASVESMPSSYSAVENAVISAEVFPDGGWNTGFGSKPFGAA